jgi:hypothetical protein
MPKICEHCGKEHATQEELEALEKGTPEPKKSKIRKVLKQEPYGDSF